MIIPTQKVQSDVEINYYHLTPTASSDTTIVFTHPTGFTSGMYSVVSAHLRNVNAIGVDIRCHGLSQRGPIDKWQVFDNDLEAVFEHLESLGLTNFVGVGISSGASAHILHVAKHPQRYKGLFLCEPILFQPGSDLEHREKLAESARNRRSEFQSRDEVYYRYSIKGPLSRLSKSALALYSKYGFKDTQDGVTLSCNKEDEEAIYLTGSANGVYEALELIDVPSIVVNGETSNTISFDFAKEISSLMKNAKHREMPKVGHFTLFENPALGAKMINDFLAELG